MKTIKISISDENNYFYLEAIDFKFSQIRGINVYIKSINNGYLDGDFAIIPLANYDINKLFMQITQLFSEKFNCSFIYSDASEMLLENAKKEAANFENFSKKAYKIRNNEIEISDLEVFIGALDNNNFRRTLKPFQLLSAYHLAYSQNACNFSVPGSGKTSAVLAAYELLNTIDDSNKKVTKLLVICPLSAFFSWKTEFYECYNRYPKVLEIKGGIAEKEVEYRLHRSLVEEDLILVSYGSVDSKKEILQSFLMRHNTMVVLDEAHRIKNVEDGVYSTAVLSLSQYAKSRIVLTGTPAPNSYVDLYNLYKFIWPSHDIIGYSISQLASMSSIDNDFRISDLINRISPFYIRVKKSDLNLPKPNFFEPFPIPMSPIQEEIYRAIENMTVRSFENSSLTEIFRKSALIRLRQASSNPNLLNKPLDSYFNDIGYNTENINIMNDIEVDNEILFYIKNYKENEIPQKFLQAVELAKKIISGNGKLLIWCEFIGTCLDLSEYFHMNNINNEILFGATEFEERERIIIDFHNKDDLCVLIANPYAVGESISLHKACHNALYFEQGFNAGVYMQSKDRIHRVGLGETDIVNYYFFHSEDSVDVDVFNRVKQKEERMIGLIESEEIPLLYKNADFLDDSEDDIKAILRSYYDRRVRNI